MDTTNIRTDPPGRGTGVGNRDSWSARSEKRRAQSAALEEIHRERVRKRALDDQLRGVAPAAASSGDQDGLYNPPIDAEKASKSAGPKGQEKRLKRPKVLDSDEAKWLSDMGKLGSAQRTFNPLVAGSNPARPTKNRKMPGHMFGHFSLRSTDRAGARMDRTHRNGV